MILIYYSVQDVQQLLESVQDEDFAIQNSGTFPNPPYYTLRALLPEPLPSLLHLLFPLSTYSSVHLPRDTDALSLVNVAGPYFVTTAFAPMLMKGDNPNVINIASIGAFALQKYVFPFPNDVSLWKADLFWLFRKVGSLTYAVSKGAGTSAPFLGRIPEKLIFRWRGV